MGLKPEAAASQPPANANWLAGVAAVAISALLIYWGTGLHPMWWPMWLAPLPVLLVAARSGAAFSFGMAAIVWFLGSLNLWSYAHRVIGIPVVTTLILLGIPACLFGLAVLLHRRFVRHGSLWIATFAFPALWVSYEFLNALTSPHSTFGNLGYTQMDFLPILQVASLTGIWGISFLLFLFSGTIAALLSGSGSATQKNSLAAAVAVIFAAVITFGMLRVVFTPLADRSVRVGLVAMGEGNPVFEQKETGEDLIRDFSQQIAILARQGAQVIVLPEKILIVPDEKAGKFDSLFEAAATNAHASILVGLDRGGDTRRFNEARLYSPDGAITAVYDKHHMIPGIEAVDVAGTTRTLLNKPSGVWGIQICKDMDFPALSREYGADGVGLLLVPAWDFGVDGWLHDRMAVMRGVESGFTIARSASEGRLSVSDDRGRILAEQSAPIRFPILYFTAPVRHVSTLYVRWGDWFGWLNVAALLAFLILLFLK